MTTSSERWVEGAALALAALAALAPGCAPSPVTVDMNFPTTAAFNYSDQGRLRIFAIGADELGICPDLLDGLPTSSFPSEPVFDSQLTSVCAFRDAMGLPELGEGPHAFLVEMRSSSNDLILQGCAIGEVYAGAPNVRVPLHPTDAYAALLSTAPPSRCGGAM